MSRHGSASDDDGTRHSVGQWLGTTVGSVVLGALDDANGNPLNGGSRVGLPSDQGRFYALSQVFQVAAASTDATLSGLTLLPGTLTPAFDSATLS